MENKKYFITTYDNPYNPWTDFDEWEAFDLFHGYKTCQRIARIGLSSTEISDYDSEEATNDAIDELCELLPALYTRIYSPS